MNDKGAYRVGISFNPSALPEVDLIKRLAADLIDAVEAIDVNSLDVLHAVEVGRLKSLAQTAAEEAAMWAVKAATKPAPEG